MNEFGIDKFLFTTMKSLFKILWLQSSNCSEPIQNMSFQIFEVSKMANTSKKEIIKYLNLLLEKKHIEKTSDEPLLYEFTESGKKVKTDSDIEKIINS